MQERRRIRLRGFDYRSPAGYFVTICTHQRLHLFGEIRNGIMHLNDFGRIADSHWLALPGHFPFLRLDDHVIMPDHMHGIIIIGHREPTSTPFGAGHSGDSAMNANDDLAVGVGPWLATALHATALHATSQPATTQPATVIPIESISESGPFHPSKHSPTRPERGSLGAIIGAYKSGVTREINRMRNTSAAPVWQYRFHDRIIRDEQELQRIRRYILENPGRWNADQNRRDGFG